MARTRRADYLDWLRRNCDPANRYVDMTTRVRVWRRGEDGKAYPAELLPEVYGGIWDTWTLAYLDERPETSALELAVHPGQLELLAAFDRPELRRILALGSPGVGKTECLGAIALLLMLWYAGKPGGFMCPTRNRINVAWGKFRRLIPAAWVAHESTGLQKSVELVNGSITGFFACKRTAKEAGYANAGQDFFWAVEEEQQDIEEGALQENDARLRINPAAQVFSGATNEPWGYFQRRIKQYEVNPVCSVVKMRGPDNTFLPLAHWEGLKGKWSLDDYRRKILLEDLPVTGKVYPAWSMRANVRATPVKPQVGLDPDITYAVTKDALQAGYHFVVGTDFGVRKSASVILKCYRGVGGLLHRHDGGNRDWYVIGEVFTEGKTTDFHASQLLEWFRSRGWDQSHFVCMTGADSNSNDPDKSDLLNFINRGFNVLKAGRSLTRTWRYNMVNACLHDAYDTHHLFVHCDAHGKVAAPLTVDSFEELMLDAQNKAESHGKGTRGGPDLTDPTDAVGYALWRFESARGAPMPDAGNAPGQRVRA